MREGGVGKALQGMGTKELKVQRALAMCLANLAQEADAAKDIIAGNRLKQIIEWIKQGDEELTGSAVSILANASNDGSILPQPLTVIMSTGSCMTVLVVVGDRAMQAFAAEGSRDRRRWSAGDGRRPDGPHRSAASPGQPLDGRGGRPSDRGTHVGVPG